MSRSKIELFVRALVRENLVGTSVRTCTGMKVTRVTMRSSVSKSMAPSEPDDDIAWTCTCSRMSQLAKAGFVVAS